jgi:hypothetical protein
MGMPQLRSFKPVTPGQQFAVAFAAMIAIATWTVLVALFVTGGLAG